MGFDRGEEFTFHWWDHVFNKAAGNIEVKNNEVCVVTFNRNVGF